MSSHWTSHTCPPSNAQLALALSILKSKPASVSVKGRQSSPVSLKPPWIFANPYQRLPSEHILSIRQYITSGKRQDVADSGSLPERHLDSVTFWRDAYETSESEQSKLHDRIYDLEQKVEALRASASRNASSTSPKHGLDESQTKGSPKKSASPAKRAKTSLTGGTQLNCDESASLSTKPEPKDSCQYLLITCHLEEKVYSFLIREITDLVTAPFMRHFCNLQMLLLKRSPAVVPLISKSVIDLCTSAENSIRVEIDRLYRPKSSSRRHPAGLRCILVGISRCYPIFLRALKKMIVLREPPCNTQIGILVYHVVGLFRKTLNNMSYYATSHVIHSGRDGEAPDGPEESPDVKSIIDSFAQVLANMALALDLSQSHHAELMEGFLYHVLEHTGEILSLFVFKDLKTDPLLTPEPNSILPIASPAVRRIGSPTHLTNKLKSAELEAKPTLWLLRHMLAHIEKRAQRGFFSNTTSPGHSESNLPRLVDRGKGRLQNTLLRGVFGAETPEFGDALRTPVSPNQETTGAPVDVSPPDTSDQYREWFTRELWAVVGWDILMQNIGTEGSQARHYA